MDTYEKKYKEALERARQFSEKPYLEDSKDIVDYIFPELKESEGDRMVKFIKNQLFNIKKTITDNYKLKANKIQQYLCDVICSQQNFWKHTNDITSPTHLNDIEEECYSQLCNLISDVDREEFEDKLKDLYWFIRKFD